MRKYIAAGSCDEENVRRYIMCLSATYFGVFSTIELCITAITFFLVLFLSERMTKFDIEC